MFCKLKALSLALAAVLAIGALSGSAALASSFHSSTEATELVAGQEGVHEMVFNVGVVVCEVAHFTAEQIGTTTEELIMVPLHTECEFAELWGITININGCDYVFTASSETEGTRGIAGCGEKKYIQFGSLATCRVRIPEQSGKSKIEYEVVGNDIRIRTDLGGIEYSESGLFCTSAEPVNGDYFGVSVMSGNGGESELSVS